ncbi:RelA/SpoT family protein [Sulfurospirillum sp. 1612]|uniref:RelA/SpoT family protein n=1 Tax=Sulfurospirillum sp. 1612 TaxID=3094835 RepID=UPI002F947AD3
MTLEELSLDFKASKDVETSISILRRFTEITPLIQKAIDFSIQQHQGQYRKSGEEYVNHPILTAALVAYYGGDEAVIVAGLLHDVVEDTDCDIKTIDQLFTKEIGGLVEGLTKIMEIRGNELIPSSSSDKIIASALTFRKMLLASISDVRVLVIKLCDRLHNMMTLHGLPEAKQKRISEETVVVYAPIAHRLGIASIKNYLEDTSFYYVMPQEYKKIDDFINEHKQQFQLRLNHFASKIRTLMIKNGFNEDEFTIIKRVKHHYSIYLKMQRKGISLEEVLDLLAIRVIVKRTLDCYKVLGIIHQEFNPLISRFKDYIAISKENGYQTIHTTVFNDKSIIESQIRTYDMDRTAEFGLAAHWKYKTGGLNPSLDWLNDLKAQNEQIDNIEEFYEIAKDNLYSEDIAVFSPKGDIFTLPRGATVLDFAYEVHTEIGLFASHAYVNKQKTPLLSELNNGDIVRIITTDVPQLRCSWINNVKTGKARNAIRVNCSQKIREINHKIAMRILTYIFNVGEKKISEWLERENIVKKVSRIAIDSVYLLEVVNLLKKHSKTDKLIFPLLKIDRYKVKKQKFENIVVYSNQNINDVFFDYCCHPKRGDDIIGFKKGNDVFVHHKLCKKANQQLDAGETAIFVKWTKEAPDRYKLLVSIENKKGSLANFLFYLAKMQINLVTIELGKLEEGHADYFDMIVEIPDKPIKSIRDNLKSRFNIIEFVSVSDAYKH